MVLSLFRRKEKTRAALARTRHGWSASLGALFRRGVPTDGLLWEGLEEVLIGADVGIETSTELVQRVRQRAHDEGVAQAHEVLRLLKGEIGFLLEPHDRGAWDWYTPGQPIAKPLVVLVVGVNGSGKTTSIAKLAHYHTRMGKKVVMAAADTFRAAAIEQLRVWGERLQLPVVAHQRGADSGAVAFDAYQMAVARSADVLLVDTAGRLHTETGLMQELEKMRRVLQRQEASAPQHTILVLDASTGQNGLAQARTFQEAVQVDGIFLAKLDGTAKGGIVVAIARELRLPVLFIGTGEGLGDLSLFDPNDFVEGLFPEKDGTG